jgi:DNA-binding NarL/FixJ family response regulator
MDSDAGQAIDAAQHADGRGADADTSAGRNEHTKTGTGVDVAVDEEADPAMRAEARTPTTRRTADGRQLDVVEELTGSDGCSRALRDLTATLRESADSLHKDPVPAGPAALEVAAALARRGIRGRTLYPQAVLREPEHAHYLRRLSDSGVAVRVADHIAHDMLIFDRQTVCLPNGDPDAPAMVRVGDPTLVRTFSSIYETYWQRATPLALAEIPPRRTELSERERTVIRLMTRGYGDDRIARKLGVVQEAVEDVMASLMERLGASSRFEIGYRLGHELGPNEMGL